MFHANIKQGDFDINSQKCIFISKIGGLMLKKGQLSSVNPANMVMFL